MSDRDPRPMPPEVLRAYRNPVDLRGLLMSRVYSEQDRRDVLEALTRSLIARYGDVWIVDGGKDVSVGSLVRGRRLVQDIQGAISLFVSIDEYGGSDGVLPLLARAMQPKWAAWWESFSWSVWDDDVMTWRDASVHVLGPRQFAWLAAQYARTAIERTRPEDRSVVLDAIEAAEAWARVPSEANGQVADYAVSAISATAAIWASAEAAYYAAYAAAAAEASEAAATAAAYVSADDADAAAYAGTCAAKAAYVAAGNAAFASPAAAYTRLAELTRSLITPTLVTSASGAVHSIGRR